MPSITIREIDSTSAGVVLSAQDVVFVPGFVNLDAADPNTVADAYTPILCETIADFESYFGNIPASFATAQPYPGGFNSDAIELDSKKKAKKMFSAGTMDPGYIYAKEMLNAGLPVLYVRCNEFGKSDDTENPSDITVAHMYEFLAGKTDYDIWSDLKDMGEFAEVKFLTSGGYPTFEYFSASVVPSVSGCTLEKFTLSDFLSAAGSVTEDTIFDFVYAEGVKVFASKILFPEEGEADVVYYDSANDKLYKYGTTGYVELTAEEITAVKKWTLYKGDAEAVTVPNMNTYGFALLEFAIGAEIVCEYLTGISTIANKMINTAASRGDCVAFIDHTNHTTRTLNPTSKKSVYYNVSNVNSSYSIKSNGEFAAMFTPWCTNTFVSDLYSTLNADSATPPKAMPASFDYLVSYAKSAKTNATWLAIAGAARGVVDIGEPNLTGGIRLSNAIADAYQPRNGISINPITNIKPYGQILWGNRTLKNNAIEGNLTATSFLNIRNLVSDVKKVAYKAAKRCMFEQNSDILWINFKGRITPTLDSMVAGSGLSGYKIIKGTTSEKAKLVCTIRLYPLYAIEDFDITVELADDDTITIS